jgi:hypothetical protein
MKSASGYFLVLLFLLFDPDFEIILLLLFVESRHNVLFQIQFLFGKCQGCWVNVWFESELRIFVLLL